MRMTLVLTFGIQMVLGNVCLMNVAYAADLPHASAHSADRHNLACEDTVCHDDPSMQQEDHQGCESGDCYTAAYPSVIGLATETGTQEVPAMLSPLFTQIQLVLGPTSVANTYRQPSFSSSGLLGLVVQRE